MGCGVDHLVPLAVASQLCFRPMFPSSAQVGCLYKILAVRTAVPGGRSCVNHSACITVMSYEYYSRLDFGFCMSCHCLSVQHKLCLMLFAPVFCLFNACIIDRTASMQHCKEHVSAEAGQGAHATCSMVPLVCLPLSLSVMRCLRHSQIISA
jgi:hypothetical protein